MRVYLDNCCYNRPFDDQAQIKVLLETLAKMNPERIVYVSCDSATQARDVKILTELGYNFIEVTPVDMFPRAPHCESVAILKR